MILLEKNFQHLTHLGHTSSTKSFFLAVFSMLSLKNFEFGFLHINSSILCISLFRFFSIWFILSSLSTFVLLLPIYKSTQWFAHLNLFMKFEVFLPNINCFLSRFLTLMKPSLLFSSFKSSLEFYLLHPFCLFYQRKIRGLNRSFRISIKCLILGFPWLSITQMQFQLFYLSILSKQNKRIKYEA